VVTGLIFIVCVSFFRLGFVGEYLAWRRRRAQRAAPPAVEDERPLPAFAEPTQTARAD
jgi:branched-chain amino acid transport system permease protein